jgi:predicted nucleic acid-binding protein
MDALSEPIFIDTDILLYAHGVSEDDPRAGRARDVLTQLWHTGNGVLSTQVLQEFYAVATKKLKPPLPGNKARGLVAAYTDWCTVPTDPALIVAAGALAEQHTLAFWDALIVEAALRAGAVRLLSEDLQHGRRFGSLLIENPLLDT